MARITNYELTQRLANANAELEVLRAEVSRLKVDLTIAGQQITRMAGVATAVNRAHIVDPTALARKAALDAAREEAMRSGRCVKAAF